MENTEVEEKYVSKGFFIFGALIVLLILCIVAILRNKKDIENVRDIKVVAIEGQAVVYRESEGYKNVYNGMDIMSGDVISTSGGSYLSITMDGNKCLMIEPESQIIFESKGDKIHNRTQITVEKGSVVSDIRKALDAQSSYEIVTSDSIVSVRGTVFRTEVASDGGNLKISVHHGKVECKPYKSDEKVVVETGKEASIKIEGFESAITELDYSVFDDRIMGFLEESNQYINNSTEDTDAETVSECVVEFIYEGSVFATKKVEKGKRVEAPVIYPAVDGDWDWDFNTPVTEDMKIEWK